MVDKGWLQSRAKEMRRAPVLYERRLWAILRDRRLAQLKFRRQVVIGRYIVDFVCLRHRLIVEADGPHHEDRAADADRDDWLRGQGFRVLRFPNADVGNRRETVLAAIIAASSPPLNPSQTLHTRTLHNPPVSARFRRPDPAIGAGGCRLLLSDRRRPHAIGDITARPAARAADLGAHTRAVSVGPVGGDGGGALRNFGGLDPAPSGA